MIKLYYKLTKPGIIYGNAINTAAGFFLASQSGYNFKLFLLALIGISLIVASACVFNNILDRKIDAKMERTKNRAMVLGKIKTSSAVIFGTILFILGAITLGKHTNQITLITAILGFFAYVILYTFGKRYTIWGTEIGSISGAMPPLVGYLAVSNSFDGGATILFLIFVLWQMPHFYAVAIYRLNEYKAAGIPILPAVKGIFRTKVNMLVYIVAFLGSLALLTVYGYAGHIYLVVMLALALFWLYMAVEGFRISDDNIWAKKMFRFSLIIVLVFCVIIPVDKLTH